MQVAATITLNPGDSIPGSSEDLAKTILESIGGDLSKDSCTCTIMAPQATVGTPPDTAPAPVPPVA